MKSQERAKCEKLIGRIQSGDFQDTDVDPIVMYLREYSNGHPVFREVADFIAHNKIRDRGTTCELRQAMALSIRFFREFTGSKRPLDLKQPFPSYVKQHMLFQIGKMDDHSLRRLGFSRKQLRTQVSMRFVKYGRPERHILRSNQVVNRQTRSGTFTEKTGRDRNQLRGRRDSHSKTVL